jgi:NAD(P)-dependent dehydrogenase (short-subunit alcohol dehydrogenase family)
VRNKEKLNGIAEKIPGAGAFANIDKATLEDFQSGWEVNCGGLFLAVKEVLPDMRAAEKGSIIVIGATASIKGGANFAPFASAKAGTVLFLAQQPPQAWSFELDLRPFGEKW